MELIKISKSDISKLTCLGEGACATVYKYNDELAIKIFNEREMSTLSSESFSQLFGIENDTVLFPKDRVEVDGVYQVIQWNM